VYDGACAGLWDAVGDNQSSAADMCVMLVRHLTSMLTLLCGYKIVSYQRDL
jgi:hypothetical protein